MTEHTCKLPDGTPVPRLGQGTWRMGDRPEREAEEIKSLRAGIDAGMTLIDTAEMYGDGASERLVGKATRGVPRDRLFLVSKVYPHNAGAPNIYRSCEDSLTRLGTDYLDLYLLHWRGQVSLGETVSCMEKLVRQGKIRRWGVSNFDVADMGELWALKRGKGCAVDQVLYHLGSRGVEHRLMPWLESRGVPVMAYCPLAQGGALRRELLTHEAVLSLAGERGITPVQLLLAFVLSREGVIAIPKASSPRHTLENAAAQDLRLTAEELDRLDSAFPPPTRRVPLDIV